MTKPENAFHPSTRFEQSSPDYRIEIDGEEVFLPFFPGMAGGDVAWLSFDYTKPITIRIIPQRKVDSVELRPLSAKIPITLEDHVATVTIDSPGHFFVKWDESFQLPLHIFANTPMEDAPDPDAEGVHYYGPGIHKPGLISLKSNETLFIAPGALVYGTVRVENAQNVKIYGRGTLCTSDIPTGGGNGLRYVIDMIDSQDITVEGLLALDSFGWTVVARNCDRVSVRNVKLLNERCFSTDGFNPCSSRDVEIVNCFARCKDDCVSIKGLQWQNGDASTWPEIKNITVKDCVFWSDNNNGIIVGTETRAQAIKNVKVENCDILHTSNTCGDVAGALSIISLDDTVIEDVTFEDIRIEWCLGPIFNFAYTNEIFRIPGSRVEDGTVIRKATMTNLPTSGKIRNITVKDVALTGGSMRRSFLIGLDENHWIEDIRFENLKMLGEPILNPEDGRFELNAFTRNITFGPGHS